jgi:hypothetical protein
MDDAAFLRKHLPINSRRKIMELFLFREGNWHTETTMSEQMIVDRVKVIVGN